MTPSAYASWYKAASGPPTTSGAGGASAAAVLAAFKSNGCTACHTFAAIPGAVGKVGPDLSLANLKASATANHETLTGVHPPGNRRSVQVHPAGLQARRHAAEFWHIDPGCTALSARAVSRVARKVRS